mgnify:CR=1 FL=1
MLEVIQDFCGNHPVHGTLPLVDRFNGIKYFLGVVLFQQVPVCTCLNGSEDFFFIFEDRQHQYLYFGPVFLDIPYPLNSADSRKVNIHQHNIRCNFNKARHRLFTVFDGDSFVTEQISLGDFVLSGGETYDSIIMEIRAGTGGDEAALFAGDLYSMYSYYAQNQGWKIAIRAGGHSWAAWSVRASC